MRKPESIRIAGALSASTKEEAWKKVRKYYSDEYMYDEKPSLRSGDMFFKSVNENEKSYIRDCGTHLDIVYFEGNSHCEGLTIWIEDSCSLKDQLRHAIKREQAVTKYIVKLEEENEALKQLLSETLPFDPDPDGTKGNC